MAQPSASDVHVETTMGNSSSPSSSSSPSPSSTRCPRCGRRVPSGYASCPRCTEAPAKVAKARVMSARIVSLTETAQLNAHLLRPITKSNGTADRVCPDPDCRKAYSSASYLVCPATGHRDALHLADVSLLTRVAKEFRSGLAAGFGKFNDDLGPDRTKPRYNDPRVHSHTFTPTPAEPARCLFCGMGSGAHSRMVMGNESSLLAKARTAANRIASGLDVSQTYGIGIPDDTGDSEILATSVLKSSSAKRFTLGPVYMPHQLDAHEEFTTGEELQKAAWDFVRSQPRTIHLQHTPQPAGEWVEIMSWPMEVDANLMIPDPDRGVVTKSVTLPAHTVYMGVIWEPWAFERVRKGKLLGYSMGGRAKRTVAILGDDPRTEAPGAVTKHGSHDQSSHGNWANGGASAAARIQRLSPAQVDRVLNTDVAVNTTSNRTLPRTGRSKKVPNPRVTGRPSLGLTRAEMPQIPTKHKKAFVDQLRGQGIFVERRNFRPDELYPTQSELNTAQVAAIKPRYRAGRANDSESPIIVSADNRILDGHHRWAAARSVAYDDSSLVLPVYQVDLGINDLLEVAHEFNATHNIANRSITDPIKVKKSYASSIGVMATAEGGVVLTMAPIALPADTGAVLKSLVGAFVEAEIADDTVRKHGSHDQSSHGNWARGGGGTYALSAKAQSWARENLSPKAIEAGEKLIRAAHAMEATTTPALEAIADRMGGEMAGLKHRFKTDEGVFKKIARKAEKKGGEFQAAVSITDALRYTMVFGADGHGTKVRDTLQTMEDSGWTIQEVEDNWPIGDAYNGINTVMESPPTPDGGRLKIELQFHTPGSYQAKNDTHSLFEVGRDPASPVVVRVLALDESRRIADSIPDRAGALGALADVGAVEVFRPIEVAGMTPAHLSQFSTPFG